MITGAKCSETNGLAITTDKQETYVFSGIKPDCMTMRMANACVGMIGMSLTEPEVRKRLGL